jgi:hypothetical protein
MTYVIGYVLTEDGNKNCLKRTGVDASMVKCDKGYSGLALQCKQQIGGRKQIGDR